MYIELFANRAFHLFHCNGKKTLFVVLFYASVAVVPSLKCAIVVFYPGKVDNVFTMGNGMNWLHNYSLIYMYSILLFPHERCPIFPQQHGLLVCKWQHCCHLQTTV